MFKNFLNKVKENEEKLKNRANVLFDKTKEKKATDTTSKKYSLKGLGDNEETELSILNDKKILDTNGKERSTKPPKLEKEENKKETPTKKKEKDYSKVADLMYPTMKKKEDDTHQRDKNGTEGDNGMTKNSNYNKIKLSTQTQNDKNFFDALECVFAAEGGYSNNKNDKGGPTNMGITQKTYDDYCKRHHLKTKDVKKLSQDDIIQVYYNDYWVKSGLNKENDPIKSLILFDTAVLHGVGRTKEFLKKSNGDIQKILDLRREHYKKRSEIDPTQKQFEKGWNNRVNRLQKMLDRYKTTKT